MTNPKKGYFNDQTVIKTLKENDKNVDGGVGGWSEVVVSAPFESIEGVIIFQNHDGNVQRAKNLCTAMQAKLPQVECVVVSNQNGPWELQALFGMNQNSVTDS